MWRKQVKRAFCSTHMNTFLHTVDTTREQACHTEMDFFPNSIKAYSAEQSKRSVCLLRVCVRPAIVERAQRLLGRPPEYGRACTPVLCLVNSAIVARSNSTILSLQIWRAIQRLSLIGSDCSHSGQLGAFPPVQCVPALQQRGPRCTAAVVPGLGRASQGNRGN